MSGTFQGAEAPKNWDLIGIIVLIVIINGDLMVIFNEIMVNDIQLIFTSHPVLANDCHIQ